MKIKKNFFVESVFNLILPVLTIVSCSKNPNPELQSAVQFSNGQAAIQVLGQKTFNATDGADMNEAGLLNSNWGTPILHQNKLYIPDNDRNRILGFNTVPTTNGPDADFVIGQTDFSGSNSQTSESGLNSPISLSIYQNKLAVADSSNNRVLLFETVPSSTSPVANLALGQADLNSRIDACTQTGLRDPQGVSITSGKLIVSEYPNNRVMIWNSIPTSSNTPADLVLGQEDFTSCGGNRNGLGANPTANTMYGPEHVWTDGTRLVISDALNNRILIWNTFPTTNGQSADIVLGQSTFSTGGYGTSASAMNGPSKFYTNGAQLFVSDCSNNRVLIWNQFPTTNNEPADNVLGQSNMESSSALTEASEYGFMGCPSGLLLIGKKLYVGDYDGNRYLVFEGI